MPSISSTPTSRSRSASPARPASSPAGWSLGATATLALTLLPGTAAADPVFHYSPVSHVSMYIGNGQMVHASTSGQPVEVVSVDSMGGTTATRRIAG